MKNLLKNILYFAVLDVKIKASQPDSISLLITVEAIKTGNKIKTILNICQVTFDWARIFPAIIITVRNMIPLHIERGISFNSFNSHTPMNFFKENALVEMYSSPMPAIMRNSLLIIRI